MKHFRRSRRLAALCLAAAAALAGGASTALLAVCGPFVDVSDAAFCPFVLEIFTLGITTGTTPTTYDPASAVNRLQMATFLSRTVDGVLRRGSRRTALEQLWTPKNPLRLPTTDVGELPRTVAFDGADLWVSNGDSDTISRVRSSDGKLLETWIGATFSSGVIVAIGQVFAAGQTDPGRLYQIDPRQPAGPVTTVANNLGNGAQGITFDGIRIWTANPGGNSVSLVTPGAVVPWTVTTVTTGFSSPLGMLYDGANVWVTNPLAGTLVKLDGNGAILQTVTVGGFPFFPTFDGANIWVPASSTDAVVVVRASTGAVLATLTGNGLINPAFTAFDGERVMVTGIDTVSLWKAADLAPIGSFSTGIGTFPAGVCSDGINFWITLAMIDKLARF